MTSYLLLGLILTVEPPPNWKVAAPAWQLENVSREKAIGYAAHLNDALRDQGFVGLSPGDTDAALTREQQTQLRTCGGDAKCLSDIGRALEIERPVSRAPDGSSSIRTRELAQGALGTGPPPALVPYQSSIPSLSIVDFAEPRNAWIPAATGGLLGLLGGQQAAQGRFLGQQDARTQRLGPQVNPGETDWVARTARVDPNRQQLAGWAGVGFGIGAVVGSAITYRWGHSAPLRVEPFAGPTGGGIGLTTRF